MHFTKILNCQANSAVFERSLETTIVNDTNFEENILCLCPTRPSALLNNSLYLFLLIYSLPLFPSFFFLITKIHHNLQSLVQMPFSP